MVRGRFVSLEGGEGVGKSTQAVRLADALRARGEAVVLTREPGGSAGAEAIRALLLEGDADRWTPEAEALLFAAARADHVARTIRPALEEGAWVISDRFIDSSRAYQGGADGIGDGAVMALHGVGSLGLMPDLTLVLDLSRHDATSRELSRDGGRLDRIGARGGGFHERVRGFFRALAETEPDRVRLIDAHGSPEDVTCRLLAAVAA